MKIRWLSENFSKSSKEEIERFIIDCKSNIKHVKEIIPFFMDSCEYLEHFKEYFNLELDEENGITPVFYVRDAKVMEYVILNGGNVQHRLKDGDDVLFHRMCDLKNIKLFEILTKHGLDINRRCNGDSLLTCYMKSYIHVETRLLRAMVRCGYNIHDDYSSVNYCLENDIESSLTRLVMAGADWKGLVNPHDIFEGVFCKIIRHIDKDMDNMVNNTIDDALKTKLRLGDDNIKPFKSSGTNFYDLPHVQILDAFHVFLYGSYAETHPLYSPTEKDMGMLEKLQLDQEDGDYYEKKLQNKLKQASIIFQCSVIGRELAQESYESCESSSKKIKI